MSIKKQELFFIVSVEGIAGYFNIFWDLRSGKGGLKL